MIIVLPCILQDVNSITVSPNDKLLATGSQDKTAKVSGLQNNYVLLQLLSVEVEMESRLPECNN